MAGRGFKPSLRTPKSRRAQSAHFERLEERRLLATHVVVAGQPAHFVDVDGDRITVKHADFGGTQVFINDDTGVWEEVRVSGGRVDHTKLTITVKPAADGNGDGRLEIELITGEEILSLNAPDVDLTGNGVGFNKMRHLTIGSLQGEAGLVMTQTHGQAMTVRIDTISTTGRMILIEDVKHLEVNEWLEGQLEVGGGVLKAIVHRTFAGSLQLDRGSFYVQNFDRNIFVTRLLKLKSLGQGTISMPRTFVQQARFEAGTTDDFSYITSLLGGRTIWVNGTLRGTLRMGRALDKVTITGNADADVDLQDVKSLNIHGSLQRTFNIRENNKTLIGGDLEGSLIALHSKRVVVQGDMTGTATFNRSGNGNSIGVRRFVVNGRMDGARLTSRYNMGDVTIKGGMFDSHIAAGAHPNRLGDEFPANLDELKNGDRYISGYIRSVDVGYNNSGDTFFEQSFILAFQLRRVKLGYAAPESDASPNFGVGALFIDSIQYRNTEGTIKRTDLRAFRITDGKFMVARIPGTYPPDWS
jgi:hypothetical protein